MGFKVRNEVVAEKTAMRDAFCQTLIELAKKDDRICLLDADLMGAMGTKPFAKELPERTVDCGIQEANMVGVACGLSMTGKIPFLHSFAPFITRRAHDQIFISGCYSGANIRLVGSDPGVMAAYNGGTHMPFEDVALYSTIPGSTIIDVTDPAMLQSVLGQCVKRPGVKYIRVGRKKYARVYADGTELPIGKAVTLKEGRDLVIFAAGIMVHEAMQAAKKLEQEGISAAVVDCFTIKPLDRETVVRWAKETGAVVVAENHNRYGGLCASVAQTLAEEAPVPCEFVAVEDRFGQVGPQDYLQEAYGLTADHVAEQARTVLRRKG